MSMSTEAQVRRTEDGDSRYVRAATLTYSIAPYPCDMSAVFEMVVLARSDSLKEQPSGGLLSRAWQGVRTFVDNKAAVMRQSQFSKHFARQLELDASEPGVVLASAHCALLSLGRPHTGILFVTNGGLFFCTEGVVNDEREVNSNVSLDSQQNNFDFTDESPLSRVEQREFIKEHIALADVASLLPSVVLPAKRGAPYLQGIPSAIVAPTALQVFTVKPNQMFQFVHFSSLVIRRPDSAPAKELPIPKTFARSNAVSDVISLAQFQLLHSSPSSLTGFLFSCLVDRAWRAWCEAAGVPPIKPSMMYASPH